MIEEIRGPIDITASLIRNPISTFYGRFKGLSVKDAGVDDGDLLIIDKSLDYKNGALAVCYLDGGFTLKRIMVEDNAIYLMSINEDCQPIEVREDDDFVIWGIVAYIVKQRY